MDPQTRAPSQAASSDAAGSLGQGDASLSSLLDFNKNSMDGVTPAPTDPTLPKPLQSTVVPDLAEYTNKLAVIRCIVNLSLGRAAHDHAIDDHFKGHLEIEHLDQIKVLVNYLSKALAIKQFYAEGSATDEITNLALPVGEEATLDAKKIVATALKLGHCIQSSGWGVLKIMYTTASGYTHVQEVSALGMIPFPLPPPQPITVSDKKLVPSLPHLSNGILMKALTGYYQKRTSKLDETVDLPQELSIVLAALKASTNCGLAYVNLGQTLKFLHALFPKATTAFGGIHPAFADVLTTIVPFAHPGNTAAASTQKLFDPIALDAATFVPFCERLAQLPTGPGHYPTTPLLEGTFALLPAVEAVFQTLLERIPESSDGIFRELLQQSLLSTTYPQLFYPVDKVPSITVLTCLAVKLKRVLHFRILKPQTKLAYRIEQTASAVTATDAVLYYNAAATGLLQDYFKLLYTHNKVSFTLDQKNKSDLKAIEVLSLWDHPVAADAPATGLDLSSLLDDLLAPPKTTDQEMKDLDNDASKTSDKNKRKK